jgi:hypothetical protein
VNSAGFVSLHAAAARRTKAANRIIFFIGVGFIVFSLTRFCNQLIDLQCGNMMQVTPRFTRCQGFREVFTMVFPFWGIMRKGQEGIGNISVYNPWISASYCRPHPPEGGYGI